MASIRIVCKGPCGRELSRTRTNFRNKAGRWLAICLTCEAEQARDRRDRYRKSYVKDWAWSYQNKLAKQLRENHTPKASTGLTPHVLRGIMQAQHGLCGLTGYTLHLPLPDNAVRSWEQWCATLSAEDCNYTPMLVRVVTSADWRPDNVFFIMHLLYDTYIACGGLKEFTKLYRTCNEHVVVVPTANAINKACEELSHRKPI